MLIYKGVAVYGRKGNVYMLAMRCCWWWWQRRFCSILCIWTGLNRSFINLNGWLKMWCWSTKVLLYMDDGTNGWRGMLRSITQSVTNLASHFVCYMLHAKWYKLHAACLTYYKLHVTCYMLHDTHIHDVMRYVVSHVAFSMLITTWYLCHDICYMFHSTWFTGKVL